MPIRVTVNSGAYQPIFYFSPTSEAFGSTQYEREFISTSQDPNTTSRKWLVLQGTDFVYANGQLVGGSITSIVFSDSITTYDFNGVATSSGGVETIEGLAISAQDFMLAFNTNNGIHGVLSNGEIVFSGASPLLTSFVNFDDWFIGGSYNDALMGGVGNDTLGGNNGNDYINGEQGDDGALGGPGNDTVFGGSGNDQAWGGDGFDEILLGEGNDTAFGEAGNDFIFGEGGDDVVLAGQGDDVVSGGAGNDYVWGEGDDDYLTGDVGDDTLFGGLGQDVLLGGPGTNVLYGEQGIDALFAGSEGDYLIGGVGTDYFYMLTAGATAGALDIIGDFQPWVSGHYDYDFIVLPSISAPATTVFDSAGYTWITTTVSGGTHYIAVLGGDAASVSNQIVWL